MLVFCFELVQGWSWDKHWCMPCFMLTWPCYLPLNHNISRSPSLLEYSIQWMYFFHTVVTHIKICFLYPSFLLNKNKTIISSFKKGEEDVVSHSSNFQSSVSFFLNFKMIFIVLKHGELLSEIYWLHSPPQFEFQCPWSLFPLPSQAIVLLLLGDWRYVCHCHFPQILLLSEF